MPTENELLTIDALMQHSGVQFGTSGARGLADAMTDRVCYAYTAGFLGYLAFRNEFKPGTEVAIAGDYRASTPRSMAAAAGAIASCGGVPVNLGYLPTPALALFALKRGIPGVMVTGSHIPDDRNGIKFYQPGGEILKPDEAGIRQRQVLVPGSEFDAAGMYRAPFALPAETGAAYREYCDRYLDFFPAACFHGLRIGLYEHSSVARDLLGEILAGLGAEVVRLGYSNRFVPVDTEAIRSEDVALARQWSRQFALDALVSTDGDADRHAAAVEGEAPGGRPQHARGHRPHEARAHAGASPDGGSPGADAAQARAPSGSTTRSMRSMWPPARWTTRSSSRRALPGAARSRVASRAAGSRMRSAARSMPASPPS